ncbi:MAG: hypothetical protein K5770_09770 [Lachnospiraceae bacterium]|nr:hypothetical protein [Lachnospiraceae bacterium]
MTNTFSKYIKNRLFYTLALNISALLASLIVFCPFFEENDDSSIALIAEGAFSTRSPFLIYTNILYGKLLNGFYAFFPRVRWHSVLQYVFAFLALCTITYIISVNRRGRMLSLVLVLSTFYEVYVSLQYSKISALSALAGYFVLISCAESMAAEGGGSGQNKDNKEHGDNRGNGEKKEDRTVSAGWASPRALIYGCLLLIFGFILREDGFLLASVFALIIIFSRFIRILFYPVSGGVTGSQDKKCGIDKETLKKATICHIKVFVPVFAVILCMFFINGSVYRNDPEWDSFITFNNIRTDLIDYRYDLLDYEAHGSELAELGISENDALLYLTWQFGDSGVFTIDLMNEVLNAPFAGNRKIDITLIKSFAKHVYDDILLFNPMFLGLLSMIGLCLQQLSVLKTVPLKAVKKIWPALLSFLLTIIALFFVLCFYEYSGRWSHRIVYAAFLMVICTLGLELSEMPGISADDKAYTGQSKEKDQASETDHFACFVPVLLISVSVITVCLGNHFDRNSFLRSEPDFGVYLSHISEDRDRLYIADTFTFQNSFKYDVFRPLKEGELGNFVTVGSWYVNSPVTMKVLGRFGYEDPFEALRSADDRVFLTDNMYAAQKLEYLNEHHGGGFFLEPLSDIGDFKQYRVVTKDN